MKRERVKLQSQHLRLTSYPSTVVNDHSVKNCRAISCLLAASLNMFKKTKTRCLKNVHHFSSATSPNTIILTTACLIKECLLLLHHQTLQHFHCYQLKKLDFHTSNNSISRSHSRNDPFHDTCDIRNRYNFNNNSNVAQQS